jgi:RNA polymerase sigma-70 factor (ECF subfamily)
MSKSLSDPEQEREWRALMIAAQGGDRDSYRRLLLDLSAWLEKYLRRRVAPSVLDDVLQEALMAVHTKRHTYDPLQPFMPWVQAIARYKWIDSLRRRSRRGEVELTEWIESADRTDAGTAVDDIARLLQRLPLAQATAIRLVRIEGLSVAEAAARAGQSESQIKVNVHRGLLRLARFVAED